jgi:hypothetical protein
MKTYVRFKLVSLLLTVGPPTFINYQVRIVAIVFPGTIITQFVVSCVCWGYVQRPRSKHVISEMPVKWYMLLEYCLSTKYEIPHGSLECKSIDIFIAARNPSLISVDIGMYICYVPLFLVIP